MDKEKLKAEIEELKKLLRQLEAKANTVFGKIEFGEKLLSEWEEKPKE